MGLLDRIGNEGLNVNYYSSIDYSSAPGEAIFINSNLILTEQSSVSRWRRTLLRGGRNRGDNGQCSATYNKSALKLK